MKRIFAMVMIVSIVLSIFAVFTPKAVASENVIFQDDFESYAVGTFPSSGGWQIVWNGAGNQYQLITDSYSHSPSKSLQLVGSYGWSIVVKRDFSSNSNLIGYEGYLMSAGNGNNPQFGTASIGFLNEPIVQWGRYYAGVYFQNGFIWSGSSDGSAVQLHAFTPYIWYKIRVVLDKTSRNYNVWVDDVLVGQNLVVPHDPNEILSLQLSEGWQGVYCYFDDVKVFEVSGTPPPTTGPVISSVSPIAATNLQTIYIYGSGFGNTWPQTVAVGDGSVDTVKSNVTPYMDICDNGKAQKTGDTSDGGENWAAGVTGPGVFCMVGIYLVSWSDNEIVLGGFGTYLGTNGQGQWYIEPGDPLVVDVFTSSGQAAYHINVAGAPPPTVSPTLQKVIPGGGTAYTVSLISSTYSANLSLSTLPKGINGYFVPATVGGVADFSYSTLFISTSISTPSGTYAIVVTATLNDPQQTSIVAQATLQVMGGIIIAVNDGGSWPTEKPIIGARVIVDSLSGVTGASGTLTFPSLSTGNHNVTISAKGYSGDPFPHAESPRVYENQYIEVSTPFKAYLYPLRYTLTIHVRDQFGQPVDGAQGTIYDSSGNIYGGFATPLWGDLTLLFQPVMTGMTMIVSKYGYQSATASYDITSDTTVNIVMYKQQTPSSSLTVHVEDAQTGVAISGATALVGDQSEITDRLGNAQFSLPPQEYVVTVSKAGYATAYARITLSSNHPAITIRILLTPQVYGLFVHVQDSQSSPISGATVTIPGIPEQFTDNGGDAVFTGLKSGSYTIAASKSGYISSSTPTNVGSSSVRITIALHIANVPDFLISVWPSYESVRPGSSASYSITLSSINGFSESVELSLGGMTISGAAIAFSPSRVQLSQGGTASSTLTISTTSAIVPGDYSLNVQGWYAGSLYGSIVHSTPVALKVDLSQYKVSITHKSSSDEPVCYLFQTTTFNVEVTDSSSGQYVDPSNYGASFDGSQCNLVHPSVGHFAYTTEPFTAKQIGQHDFTYHCSSAPGTSFISSDSVLVRLHKNEINLLFSTQEQYFPVDGMFFDDDNDISNNAANYLVGTKPSLVNAYYYLASDASNYYVIEYWTYYAYNKYTAYDVIPDNHEHDFESIYVWVDKSTHLVTKMILSQHSWVNKYDSSIPLVISLAVEEGGHGTIMAHAQGNSYIFDEPSNAVSMPPFKGDFIVQQHGSSSAVIPLNPAYYYAEGYSIKGFGDQSTLTYGLNYDAIWPFVGDLCFFSSLGAKFGPVGFVVGTFSGITYAVFWDREVFRIDVLSSQHPFSVPTLTGSIKFYITAPWGRAAFIDPDIEDHKGGYVPTDPVKFVKDFPKAYVSNLVRIFRNVFPDMWVPQITISIDPINVSIIDSQGRVLGNKDGSFVNEIVGGQVLYSDDLLTILSIANATDNYTIELASISTGKYTVKFSMLYSNAIVDFEAIDIPVEKGSVHAYTIDWHALANGESGTTVFVDQFGTGNFQTFQVGSNLTGDQFASLANMSESPRTTLTLTQPNLVQQDTTYVSTATQFILFPSSQRLYQQTDGFFFTSKTSSDIAGTFYRIYNSTYDIGWQNYTEPFCLWNLQEGNYTVKYYSTDKLNNVEPTNTMQVTLHRPRVSGVTTDKNIVGRGLPMSVNVTVTSQVDCLETLNITIFANETLIGTLENVTLASGESTTMTFAWNTTQFAFGNFVVGAHEQPSVFGENSTAESPFCTRVVITIRGDINGDFTVDIYDAIILANAYGSNPSKPNWNPNADINGDNIVDIYDAIILANHYNQHYP